MSHNMLLCGKESTLSSKVLVIPKTLELKKVYFSVRT